MTFNEHDILTCCALRFDGRKYAEDRGLDYRKAVEDFFETRQWNLTVEERLAVFFLLQRALCKWDLEYEPQDGKYWRAFRSLFFLVCDVDVPKKYRSPEFADWAEQWEMRYKPNLEECVRTVRRVHEATVYKDE